MEGKSEVIEALKEQLKRKSEEASDLVSTVKEKDERIQDLENMQIRRRVNRVKLLWSIILIIIFILLEGTALYLSNKYGSGNNLFQKITSSWVIFCFIQGLIFLIWRWIIRKLYKKNIEKIKTLE